MSNYEVNLKWIENRKGSLSSPVLPQKIEVATPPDFPKWMKEIWSPEYLFVASINSYFMTTFLSIAKNSKFDFISFESKYTCMLDKIEGKYLITEIILKPKLIISYFSKTRKSYTYS